MIAALAHVLNSADHAASPTFTLVNEYHFPLGANREGIIYHMDWYRLKDATEGMEAGMETYLHEALAGNAWCLIEWPEKAAELIRPPFVRISLQAAPGNQRSITAELYKTS